jgi:uncharacterized protein
MLSEMGWTISVLIHHDRPNCLLGIISDTHGMFRSEIKNIFKGVDYIIHAGDIGGIQIIHELEKIAPVLAVTGNTDDLQTRQQYPETAVFETPDVRLFIIHNISMVDFDLKTAGFDGIIFGHTHQAEIKKTKEIIYLNPGSAGLRRFKLEISVALLKIKGKHMSPEIYLISEDKN